MDPQSIKTISNKVAFKPTPPSLKNPTTKIYRQPSSKGLSHQSSIYQLEGSNYQEFESIKRKHDKIALLESEIANVQKKLTDFYFKMKEVLLKDHQLSRELKEVFFSENLREQILQCDSITMIDFLQKIIIGAVDLSHNLMDNCNYGSQLIKNDSDYVIILQKLEEEIILLKQRQIEDEYITEALKSKIEELQDQNSRIVEKSAQTAQSFKQDYYKLLTIIHEFEYDITHLKDKMTEKDAQIQTLNEKNFSIYVLEHKIKSLDQKYRKDFSKEKAKFNKEMIFMKDCRISDPNFYQKMHGIDVQIKGLENKLYSSNMKKHKIEGFTKIQREEINEEKNALEKKINQLNNEGFEMKEKMAEKNREIVWLRQEFSKRNEVRAAVVKSGNITVMRTIEDNFNNNNDKKIGKSFNINNSSIVNKSCGNK